RVVMKALEQEPERRFPDVQTFIDALEQGQNQLPRNPTIVAPVQPTGAIAPPIVAPAVIPSTAPIDLPGTVPAFPAPAPSLLTTKPQVPVPPTFQGMPPMRVTPLGDPPIEPLGQVPQKFQKATPKQLPPPSEPPARRPEGTSLGRRVFAVGLIG